MMPRKPGKYWNESWNPVTGCTPCSPACENCWAEATAERLPQTHGKRAGKILIGFAYHDTMLPIPFSEIVLHPDRLDQPLHWKKPRVVAVSLMGDLFHEDVPFRFHCDTFEQMILSDKHTYLVLTKRPDMMATFCRGMQKYITSWPAPNVWLGVSVWDQESADRNIPILLDTPAAHHWISVEPMLGEVDLGLDACSCGPGASCDPFRQDPDTCVHNPHLNQVIAGCESGPNRRPALHAWLWSLKAQCLDAGVPYFLKQASACKDGTGRVVKEPPLDGKQHLDLAWEAER